MWDVAWRLSFAVAVLLLILGLLLFLGGSTPGWYLAVYPSAGAILALIASRARTGRNDAAGRTAGFTVAAAFLLTAALVNVFLIDFLTTTALSGDFAQGGLAQRIGFLVFPAAAFCFWWALARRRKRHRAISEIREEVHRFHGRRSDPVTGLN